MPLFRASRYRPRRDSVRNQSFNLVRYGQWNEKVWRFSTSRTLEDRAFLDEREDLQAKGDVLHVFLSDHDVVSVARLRVEEFCYKWPSSAAYGYAAYPHPERAWAWADTHPQSAGHRKGFPNWLDSDQLCAMLKEFTPKKDTMSYRQLIYIPQLDPDYIVTLAKTALHHQVEALRDTIYKHVAAVTSIKVRLPIRGFPIFRLEFHLTRLALMSAPSGQRKNTARGVLSDLTFLNLSHPSGKSCGLIIEKSQFDLLICGWDDTKWTAYAFGNRAQTEDEHEPEEDIQNEQNDQAEQEHLDVPEDEPNEDVIATDPRRVIDVDPPIRNPRLYFLFVIESVIHMAAEDGAKMVCRIEENIEVSKSVNTFDLEWTTRAMKLLSELRLWASSCLRTWEKFVSRDGDINYFSDMNNPEAVQAFESIKDSYDILAELREKLNILYISCQENATIINLYMSQEGNRMTLESCRLNKEANAMNRESHQIALETNQVSLANNFNAAQMLSTTQIVTPVVIVTSYFSTQDKVFGFSRDARSFLICLVVVTLVLKVLDLANFVLRQTQRWKGTLAGIILLGQWEHLIKRRNTQADEEKTSRALP